MFEKQPSTYILASKQNGTLYTGVTSNLQQRIYQHKYGAHHLVYYELHETMETTITREKQIKKWNRKWKLALIEKENPDWKDLYEDIV